MADKKKIVVVGYGGMGGWHAKRLLESDVCELVGVCDISEARKAKAIENGLRVYNSIDEVLADDSVEIVTLAVQKCATNITSEITVTVVPLPNDELKGRIIGREGRNIRAIENATGVDLIIWFRPS